MQKNKARAVKGFLDSPLTQKRPGAHALKKEISPNTKRREAQAFPAFTWPKITFLARSARMKGFILHGKAAEMFFLRERCEKSPRPAKPDDAKEK